MKNIILHVQDVSVMCEVAETYRQSKHTALIILILFIPRTIISSSLRKSLVFNNKTHRIGLGTGKLLTIYIMIHTLLGLHVIYFILQTIWTIFVYRSPHVGTITNLCKKTNFRKEFRASNTISNLLKP
jgi:hypothetical protein